MDLVLFYTFGSLILLLALFVVLARNPVYSAGYLVLALLLQAGIFAILGATFLAVIQVLIYAGAVMVLFIFVVMLIRLREEDLYRPRLGPIPTVGALVLFGEIAWVIYASRGLSEPAGSGVGSVAEIGREIFGTYAVPLEVLSLLLLAAIVGAVTLGRRRPA